MSRAMWIMLAGLLAFLASPVVAKTINVGPGGDYTTVQAAIDAALDGDKVVVARGTYQENINLSGKKITVRSTNPTNPAVVAATILDGHQAGSVVTFNHGETSQSILEGFTITGGTGTQVGNFFYGGGIYCVSASPTIRNNTLRGNSAIGTFGYGGGIYCGSASPTICNNILLGNSGIGTYSRGGGIYCDPGSSPTIANDTLSGNSAGAGGGIFCWGLTIVNCIVAFSSAGGGLSVVDLAPTVTYSDFYGNTGGDYYGLPADPTGTNHNISSDPLFADATNGDFHEKSRGGRWNPKQKRWVVDAIQGACIDAGDPAAAYGQEPQPNGGRINMGAYGNTAEASKSAAGHNFFHVPGDCATIQGAIDAASDGDEVAVARGTYSENLNFGGRKITVRSTKPTKRAVVAATVIHGQQSWSVVTFNHGETSQSLIEGFTITGGIASIYGAGAGVECGVGSSPTVQNSTLSGNAGGGIFCDQGSSATIRNNNVTGNASYGIGCKSSSPTIQNNNIVSNSGGGISCQSASPTIRYNTLRGNSGYYGGGISCGVGSSPMVANNTFDHNSARAGGGIYCDQGSSPTIANNILTENSAVWFGLGDGGGICCLECSPTIVNNTLWRNSVDFKGGGIYCVNCPAFTITNCIVAFSSAGGGLVVLGGPTVAYCDFYRNKGGDYAGLPSDPTGTQGNISADPLFASAAHGDFHEKSRGGRWDPEQERWVVDTVHSPCIDAGGPRAAFDKEPAPNGGRINMGAYGNTPKASKSAPARTSGEVSVTVAAYPTASGLVQITVNLASAASVQVSVLNVAGRAVAVLPPQDLPEGLSTLLWSGRSSSGTMAPAGRYLVRVTARGLDGSQAQALASLSLGG